MGTDIRHERAKQQFITTVDGHDCVLAYELAGATMTITHTEVPPAVGGRGIAGMLTRSALDAARELGWRVIPACSYARQYFDRHPEYADLLA